MEGLRLHQSDITEWKKQVVPDTVHRCLGTKT